MHTSSNNNSYPKKRFSGSSTSRIGEGAARSSFGGPRKFSRPSFGGGRPGGHSSGYAGRSAGGFSRGGFGASRGGFRGGNRGGRGQGPSERIDYARFINKAVITEEVEHFKPEHQFTDFNIQPELKANIVAKKYVDPTPIQDRAIPHILKGLDVVGIANTGTGKTAAFLIPLINKVLMNRKEQVFVVVPTRELAIQIEQELIGFVHGMKIFSVCCVGGAPIGKQISQLRYQNNFIIGTPGRLKDLVDRKMIRLPDFNTIVLDEADRMLDMGFVNEMRALVAQMPAGRHTLFFSATLSSEIEKLIKEFLREPVRIFVKTGDTSKNVDQDVVKIDRGANKIDVLQDLLKQAEFSKVLIFGRTKHGVEKLSKILTDKGFKAESIHGNKNHSKRQSALTSFKTNRSQILVATDVAARGLDIDGVTHVINFDVPATYDDYVHRIGRTGRGGKKGKALTFVEGSSR
jgi:superfamily II DNA/RNA helicase